MFNKYITMLMTIGWFYLPLIVNAEQVEGTTTHCDQACRDAATLGLDGISRTGIGGGSSHGGHPTTSGGGSNSNAAAIAYSRCILAANATYPTCIESGTNTANNLYDICMLGAGALLTTNPPVGLVAAVACGVSKEHTLDTSLPQHCKNGVEGARNACG